MGGSDSSWWNPSSWTWWKSTSTDAPSRDVPKKTRPAPRAKPAVEGHSVDIKIKPAKDTNSGTNTVITFENDDDSNGVSGGSSNSGGSDYDPNLYVNHNDNAGDYHQNVWAYRRFHQWDTRNGDTTYCKKTRDQKAIDVFD